MLVRALVVDDERHLREVLCEFLESDGIAVATASDGEEALAHLRSGAAVDVLIMDDDMPRMKGRDALQALRTEGHGVPVVLVSGSLTLTPEECGRLGVGPVLRKPVGCQDLLNAVRLAVGLSSE